MATFVLVPGAWHGGWCYRDTAKALRTQGHTVFTPTLSGNGERNHQNHEGITLETHIRDVIGVFTAEELSDVVLLGHSYGGMVITGVADRIPEKIKQLIYLDAFVPENGDTLSGLLDKALPKDIADVFHGAFYGSAGADNSQLMAPIPAAMFGIKLENQAWVDRRCNAQALATFEVPLLLSGKGANLPKHFLLADAWDPSPFRYFAAKLAGQPQWTQSKLPSSHDVMVDMPHELATEIVRFA
ncbi:MAG: alpha/beta hydrolase [Rhizobacter sp.]|nr:alpha/beta hydrolase [Burkholderiales bacterium]